MRRLVLAGWILLAAVTANGAEPWDVRSDTWVATDALGRSLPTFAEVGPPRKDKTVGIFYFLWVNQRITNRRNGPVHDISRMLKENPANPAYGPKSAFHFWGEPELGYYTQDDPYVIRKHLQYLLDAQVDVLIFDVTNALTYHPVYMKLCEVYDDVRKAGGKTPQVCFITNSNAGKTVQRLYDEFYSKKHYPDLWFRWLGKPLVLAPPEELSEPLRRFFTVRRSWAWSNPKGWFKDGKDKWCWIDHYPQKPGWHVSPDKPEQISVCAAQHATTNIGRSFHAGKQPPKARWKTAEGPCFAEQWRRALEVDPAFLFVTGWNEWIAQRFLCGQPHRPRMLGRKLKDGETYFVDQYNAEYSRDIEPMKGGFTDNYYHQMIDGIRRFRGVRPPDIPRPGAIRIDGSFDDWTSVRPEFRDHIGDTIHRDSTGWNKTLRYVDKTGRNDFVRLKVSYDTAHVYFYAETAGPITSRKDPHWMELFIDVDRDPKTGWEGYDVRVNAEVTGDATTMLKRFQGGAWVGAGTASFRVSGNRLELAVARKTLGLAGKPVRFDFHWADNIQKEGQILAFALHGDSAPDRRFNYRYDSTITQATIDAWAKQAAKARSGSK